MGISIKKQFYQLNQNQFQDYLERCKNSPSCMTIFGNQKQSFFYLPNEESIINRLKLHQCQFEFDFQFGILSTRKQKMIRKSYIIDEIKMTNATENIYSTRKDIFCLINDSGKVKDKQVKSILQAYQLLENNEIVVEDIKSIRSIYDQMMQDCFLSDDDQMDGVLFRKENVDVVDGIKAVHQGFYPEENIILGMEEFVELYKNEQVDIYLRLILTHFVLETIHPFNDGNGRLGRLLMSALLYNQEKTVSAFFLSSSIHRKKSDYYHALKNARDIHEFGCLNQFEEDMISILLQGLKEKLEEIFIKEKLIETRLSEMEFNDYTKTEKQIYEYLLEASCYSYFGVNNEDIMNTLNISKRTLISTMNKFRTLDLLKETKIGNTSYHKLKGIDIFEDIE